MKTCLASRPAEVNNRVYLRGLDACFRSIDANLDILASTPSVGTIKDMALGVGWNSNAPFSLLPSVRFFYRRVG